MAASRSWPPGDPGGPGAQAPPADRAHDELAFYVEALGRGELAIQQCAACGQVRWPPRPSCPHCRDLMSRAVVTAGEATLFSWTVIHRSALPGFTEAVPYAVGIVELTDQPVRMIGALDVAIPALTAGMPLRLQVQPSVTGDLVPVWHAASGQAEAPAS
jgi:uncharacterized OB-fold protein